MIGLGAMANSRCALILPGAVSKGAFEAGVISVIAEKNIKINHIVATSSGALNGVALAAAIRSGREKEIAKKLLDAWIEGGGWYDTLNFNPINWLRGRGLSGADGLLKNSMILFSPFPIFQKMKLNFELLLRLLGV